MVDGPKFYIRKRGSWLVSDNCYDTPAVRQMRSRLRRGRGVDEALGLLDQHQNPNDRAYHAEALADWWDKPLFLQRAGDRQDLALIRGIFGVKRAWRERGSAWVPKNFGNFQTRLRYAEADLLHAASARPRDPTPLSWLIVCYRGLQSPSSGEDAFAEAMKRDRGLRHAYSALLCNKSPSWFGSEDEMTEFVFRSVRGSAPGSGLESLLPEVYSMMPTSEAASDALWKRADVAALMAKVHAKLSRADTPDTMETLRARNWMAYALWKSGHFSAALSHLEVIGRRPQVLPWGQDHPLVNWFSNQIHKARRECRRGVQQGVTRPPARSARQTPQG